MSRAPAIISRSAGKGQAYPRKQTTFWPSQVGGGSGQRPGCRAARARRRDDSTTLPISSPLIHRSLWCGSISAFLLAPVVIKREKGLMVKSPDHDGHKDWGYDEKYQLGGKNRGKSRYMDPYNTSYPHMGFNRDGEQGGFQDCEGNNTTDSRGFQAYEDHERQSCIGESVPTGTRNFYGDNQEFQDYHDRRKRYDERKKPEKYGKDQLDGKNRGKSRFWEQPDASYPHMGCNREQGGFQDCEGNNTNNSRGFQAYENRGEQSRTGKLIPMTTNIGNFYGNNQSFQVYNDRRKGDTTGSWTSRSKQDSDMGDNRGYDER